MERCGTVKLANMYFVPAWAGVLDIAGGQGALAFQLQAVHGVRCTCIDPRMPGLSHEVHKFLKQQRIAATASKSSSSWSSSTLVGETSLKGCDAEEEHGHVVHLVSTQADRCHAATGVELERGLSAAEDPADETETRGNASQDGGCLETKVPGHITAHFNEQLWQGEHAAHLQAASIYVGLHPDQARCPTC